MFVHARWPISQQLLTIATPTEQKYWQNMWSPQHSAMRAHLGGYLCRTFPEVKFHRMVFITRVHHGWNKVTAGVPVSLWSHYCDDQYKKEYEEYARRTDHLFTYSLPEHPSS